MFWRSVGLAQTSPLESILDRDNHTVEDLLDDDGVIQECKSLNSRLVNFLKEKRVVEKLVRYIIDAPVDGMTSEKNESSARYSYVSCEIFMCEIEAIFNTLLDDNGQLFSLLFSFLDDEGPLNSLFAGYFSKVVGCVLARRATQCSAVLQKKPGVIQRLVHHVGTTSVAEVLLRLIGPEDSSLSAQSSASQRWLADSTLLSSLLARLGPTHPPAVQANVAEVLAGVARTAPCLLAQQLATAPHLRELFAQGLAPGNSRGLMYVLDVAIAIVSPKQNGGDDAGIEPSRVVGALLPHIGALSAKLSLEGDVAVQETTWGELRPPLGQVRLKVVEFFATMLRTQSPPVTESLMRMGVFAQCVGLMISFPFNNFLHHHVESMVMYGLCEGGDELRRHVVVKCELPARLAEAPTSVNFGGWAKPKILRTGYLGHLTRIGNKLLDLGCGGGWLGEALSSNEKWRAWVNNYLKERNDTEALNKWACGRPSLNDGGNSEDDDLSKDFDMSSMSNSMGLSRDVYNRYAGAGNEEDEDDEEEEAEGEQEVYTSWEQREDGSIDFSKLSFSENERSRSAAAAEEMAAAAAAAAASAGSSGADGGGGGGTARGDAGDSPTADDDAMAPTPDFGAGDDDEVILVGYDEDADTSADSSSMDRSPVPAPSPGSPEKMASVPPMMPEDSAFNSFNFWRNSYDLSLVPDDI